MAYSRRKKARHIVKEISEKEIPEIK